MNAVEKLVTCSAVASLCGLARWLMGLAQSEDSVVEAIGCFGTAAVVIAAYEIAMQGLFGSRRT